MTRTLIVAVVLANVTLTPSMVNADPPDSLLCVIPIERGHEAFDNRINLNVADYGGMDGAAAYCRDVLQGHPSVEPAKKM